MPAESPLPPAQRQIFSWRPDRNSTLSVSFGQVMDRARWQQAGAALLARHPLLRAGLSADGQRWIERDLMELPEELWQEPDWSEISTEEISAKWQLLQEEEETRLLGPGDPLLWRWHLLRLPGGHSHFLWTIHPALLEEKHVGALLLEWFSRYENPPEDPAAIVSVPPLAAAIASLEIEEDETPARTALAEIDQPLLDPWQHFAENHPGEETAPPCILDLPPGWREEHAAWCELGGFSPAEGLTLLWAGFCARLHPRNQSLTVFSSGLEKHLAPEHRHLVARMNPWLPLRAGAPGGDQSAVLSWAGQLQADKRELERAAFTPWPDWLARAASEEGLRAPQTGISSRIRWREVALNDMLHTALPRWLGVDAVWKEAPLFPLEVELAPGRVDQLLLRTRSPRSLGPAASRWILTEFLRLTTCLHRGEEFAFTQTSQAPSEEGVGFQLTGEPSLVEKLNAALVEQAEQTLFRCGDDALLGRDILHYSNQLARFLRRQKFNAELPVCVSLVRGPWLAIGLLTLVRERQSFFLLDPDAGPGQWPKNIPQEEALLLLDSAMEEAWAESPVKKIVLDTAWEKISAFPTAELSPRKTTSSPRYHFGSTPEALGEGLLEISLRGISSVLCSQPGDRQLSTAPKASPALLEEILLAVLSGHCLDFVGDGQFATRSDFQEALRLNEISHVVLPAQIWADWTHFLLELRLPCPPTLRRLVVRGGSISPGLYAAWRKTGFPEDSTVWVWSPWDLPGVGWQHQPTAAAEETAPRAVDGWLLGRTTPGCQALALDAADRPLPPTFVGRLAVDLPDSAILDGTPRRRMTNFWGHRDEAGNWRVGQPVDQPADHPVLPARVLQQLQKSVADEPAIFDAIFLPGSRKHSVQAWIIPFDSHQTSPGSWAKNLASAVPPPWQLTALTCLPRYPVTESGALDWALLPEPAPLDRMPSPVPSTKTSQSPTPAASTPRPSPAPTLLWLQNESATSAPEPGQVVVLLFTDEETSARALAGAFPDDTAIAWLGGANSNLPLSSQLEPLWQKGFLLLVAEEARVWTALRSASLWPTPEKEPPPPILLAPTAPAVEGRGLKQKFQGLWLKWTRNGGNQTRREGAATPRTIRWDLPAHVLLDGMPPASLLDLFPAAEFYTADLTTPENRAAALRDVLAESESPTEETPPPGRPE